MPFNFAVVCHKGIIYETNSALDAHKIQDRHDILFNDECQGVFVFDYRLEEVIGDRPSFGQ